MKALRNFALVFACVIAGYFGGALSTEETQAQIVGGGQAVQIPPGTEREPGLYVTGDRRTGLYSDTFGQLKLVAEGRDVQTWNRFGISQASPLLLPSGTPTAPSIGFVEDPDLGIYKDGVSVAFTVGGLRQIGVANGFTQFNAGTQAVPSLTFFTDANTGVWRPGADTLGFAAGGEDLGQWKVARGTLTATQVRTLFTTPVEIIAAPGASTAIILESAQLMLDWNANAYDSVGATENLNLGTASQGQLQCDPVTCIAGASVADNFGFTKSSSVFDGRTLVANEAVTVSILNGNWALADNDANGDSPIHYLLRYREVATDLS